MIGNRDNRWTCFRYERNLWCFLDAVLMCHLRYVCDKHDEVICRD